MSCLNASRGDPAVSVMSGDMGPCVEYHPVESTACMASHIKSEEVLVAVITDVILEVVRHLSIFESKFKISRSRKKYVGWFEDSVRVRANIKFGAFKKKSVRTNEGRPRMK